MTALKGIHTHPLQSLKLTIAIIMAGASEGELSLLVSDHQFHKTLPAVHMQALERFGVSVGLKTNGTVELVF